MRTRIACCLCMSALFSPHPAHAAAWLLPHGESQLIQNVSYYSADAFYSANGTKTAQPEFTKLVYSPYYEHGFSETLTGGFSLSFEQLEQSDTNQGVGDSEWFLRQELWKQSGLILSLQPLVKLPRLSASEDSPALGSDNADAELRLLGGYGFSDAQGRDHFADAEIAYRTRFGSPGDQIRFDAKLGLRPIDRWMVITEINSTWHVGSAGASTGLISSDENYDLVKAQFSAVYELGDGRSVQAGIFSDIHSRNTGSGEGVLLSLWMKF
ncbi:MAG: hypothetical protein IT567_06375 [Alphaproteobacteria bacterium]|nr:hypothetical protein [Alphaproteobacteria bacterium]